jgi:hypothetical protein
MRLPCPLASPICVSRVCRECPFHVTGAFIAYGNVLEICGGCLNLVEGCPQASDYVPPKVTKKYKEHVFSSNSSCLHLEKAKCSYKLEVEEMCQVCL